MKILRPASGRSRLARVERCHWPEGCNNNVGVTAGKASHNTSNATAVTAVKMGRNSSVYNHTNLIYCVNSYIG